MAVYFGDLMSPASLAAEQAIPPSVPEEPRATSRPRRFSPAQLEELGAIAGATFGQLPNTAAIKLAALEGRPLPLRNPQADMQQALAGVRARRAEERQLQEEDQRRALQFVKAHQDLAKIPPGPEKAYLVDQYAKFLEKHTGESLPREYVAMLKKQNEEQQQAMASFLAETTTKYGLGLSQGLAPLLRDRPDQIVELVGREMELQRKQQLAAQAAADQQTFAELVTQLQTGRAPGGVTEGSSGGGTGGPPLGAAVSPVAPVLPAGVPPRLQSTLQQEALQGQQALAQAATQPSPAVPTATVTAAPQGSHAGGATAQLDARILAYDQALGRLGGLSLTPENQRAIQRLTGERDRLLKEREFLFQQGRYRDERSDIRIEQSRKEREEALNLSKFELQQRESQRQEAFQGLQPQVQQQLRIKGQRNPTPEEIAQANEEVLALNRQTEQQSREAAARLEAQKVDPVQARQVGALSVALGHLKGLEEFSPKEIQAWVGAIRGRVARFQQLQRQDPRFQAFVNLTDRIRASILFSRTEGGGGALTPREYGELVGFNLSGTNAQGALGYLTNAQGIRRDLEGKLKGIAGTSGLQRSDVLSLSQEISTGMADQSRADLQRLTEQLTGKSPGGSPSPSGLIETRPERVPAPGAFPAPSPAPPGGAQQGAKLPLKQLTEKEILAIRDEDLNRLEDADLTGLTAAQLRALKARLQRGK